MTLSNFLILRFLKQKSSCAISQLCEKMYEVKKDDLCVWLIAREIVAGGESVRKPLTTTEVSFSFNFSIIIFQKFLMPFSKVHYAQSNHA